jgi:hypothetical protein
MRCIPSLPERIPNPLYVDITAVNGGIGTKDSPFNSLTDALALATGREGQVICLKAPETNPFRVEPSAFQSTEPLTIQGWDHEPWYIYGSEVVTGWTSIGGGVWSKFLGYTSVNIATVMTMTETIGDREFKKKLIEAAVATAPAQGEIGYDGATAYIRLPSDENPNSHTIEVARRNTAFRPQGFAAITIEDMIGRNFLSAAITNGLSTQPLGTGKLIVRNSLIEYTGLNGITASAQNELTECYNVQAYRCTNDGFNHRRISGAGIMTLNGCKGGYNGDRAGQSSQGASAHTDATLIINGGQYNWNVSGGMVSIDTSVNNLHGDTAYGPILMDHNMRLGNTAGTIASQASCAWVNTATGIVTGPVTVSNGGGVGVRVNTPNAVTGLNNIQSINNALPDIIA